MIATGFSLCVDEHHEVRVPAAAEWSSPMPGVRR